METAFFLWLVRVTLLQRPLQFRVMPIGVVKKADRSVRSNHGGRVVDHDGQRTRQIYLSRRFSVHRFLDLFSRPGFRIVQHPRRELGGILEANTSVTEITAAAREQVLSRRAMEVNVVIVREDEF